MFVQNLKSVALPVPEIIGGIQNIWAVPGYAHAPFSPKFLMDFYNNNNNNNNNHICIAPACRMTSEALADSSSRPTECLTEK